MTTKVEWWPNATLALLNLPRLDAETIDRAVQQWAATGDGVVHAADGGLFLLYIGLFVIEFTFDDTANAVHVVRIRRA